MTTGGIIGGPPVDFRWDQNLPPVATAKAADATSLKGREKKWNECINCQKYFPTPGNYCMYRPYPGWKPVAVHRWSPMIHRSPTGGLRLVSNPGKACIYNNFRESGNIFDNLCTRSFFSSDLSMKILTLSKTVHTNFIELAVILHPKVPLCVR